jgi:hypothetical protein
MLQVGADLLRAKELLGHGNFGRWLDREFGLSHRTAEQFMAASRRFGAKSEIVSHLPAGVVLELSAPSVPDELVERVIAGEVPPSPASIRREKAGERTDERAYAFGGTFMDYLGRFNGDRDDYAAGIAAHVIRRWKEPDHRVWFACVMRRTAEMIEENQKMKVPLIELPGTTVRKLKERRS